MITDRIQEAINNSKLVIPEAQKRAQEEYNKMVANGLIDKPKYSLMGVERYTRART